MAAVEAHREVIGAGVSAGAQLRELLVERDGGGVNEAARRREEALAELGPAPVRNSRHANLERDGRVRQFPTLLAESATSAGEDLAEATASLLEADGAAFWTRRKCRFRGCRAATARR